MLTRFYFTSRMMKRFAPLMTLIACSLAPASAQRTHGYVFAAPGGITDTDLDGPTLHFGGGAEIVLPRGVGIGGEVGVLSPGGKVLSSIGVASANAYYHFGPKGRIGPYVTGGYSLLFRGDSGSGANFGAGVNLWFFRSLGLKLEFRDHLVSAGGVTNHWWGGRVGLNF